MFHTDQGETIRIPKNDKMRKMSNGCDDYE